MKALTLRLLFVLACFTSPFLAAQSGNNEHCKNPSNSLLWEVKGESSTVYLFGTLHFGKSDFYPMAPEIETAFRSAENLVFEVDLNDANSLDFALKMQQEGLLPPGTSLKDQLSPGTVEKLIATTQRMGLPSAQLMQLKPWFLSITLTAQQLVTLGYQPDLGTEYYLARERSEGTQILELESLDEQLKFLQKLNNESFLEYTLDSLNEGSELLSGITKAWECADKDTLAELLVESFDADVLSKQEAQELKDVFLINRNKKMAEQIDGYLKSGQGSYFVAVGAAHYLGEDSIIDFLQDKKYSVKAVKLKQ